MSIELKRKVKEILGRNLSRTHWGKRIVKAARRGRFLYGDGIDAGAWPACACGKTYSRHPYKFNRMVRGLPAPDPYCPGDSMLRKLGQAFSSAVQYDNIADAAILLVKIEARAAEGV